VLNYSDSALNSISQDKPRLLQSLTSKARNSRSDQAQPERPANELCGALQYTEGDVAVLGIEQAANLAPARFRLGSPDRRGNFVGLHGHGARGFRLLGLGHRKLLVRLEFLATLAGSDEFVIVG
jgi:hypothetical protein